MWVTVQPKWWPINTSIAGCFIAFHFIIYIHVVAFESSLADTLFLLTHTWPSLGGSNCSRYNSHNSKHTTWSADLFSVFRTERINTSREQLNATHVHVQVHVQYAVNNERTQRSTARHCQRVWRHCKECRERRSSQEMLRSLRRWGGWKRCRDFTWKLQRVRQQYF